MERIKVGFFETRLIIVRIRQTIFDQLDTLSPGLAGGLDDDVLQPGLRVDVFPDIVRGFSCVLEGSKEKLAREIILPL